MGAFNYRDNSAASNGGSRWVTNPKHLPRLAILQTALNIKTGIGAQSLSSVAGFYTAMARDGAESAITVADTYVTVASLTGAGFLFNAVLPTHSAGYRPTVRITVDGTVYTISPSADQTALWRMVLGPLTIGTSIAGVAAAAIAGDVLPANGAWDSGFTNAKIGGLRQYGASSADFLGIPTESAIQTNNWPALRFESSLVVEMKCNLLSGTAAHKQCGITYLLDL